MPDDPFDSCIKQLLGEAVQLPEHTNARQHLCRDWTYHDAVAAAWLAARGLPARRGLRRPRPDVQHQPAADSEGGDTD